MPILFELKDHVARVTIDRPDVLNAIDAASERELQKIWDEIESNRDVRVRGADRHAASARSRTGADMKGGSGASGLEYWALPRPGGFGGIALRETLDVPVIARVNGHAVGGGFEMVLGCDIIVAAEEATFGLPEARVGRLPLDGGMTLLQRQVPFHLAMGLLLTGKRINGRGGLAHRPRQRGGAARRARRRGRALGRRRARLRAAVGARDQAGGAAHRAALRRGGARPAAARARRGAAVGGSAARACAPSSRSASRCGRASRCPTSSPTPAST